MAKPFIWRLELHVDPSWVADGFGSAPQATLEEVFAEAINSQCLAGCATSEELRVRIVGAPTYKAIRVEQGYSHECLACKSELPVDRRSEFCNDACYEAWRSAGVANA